MQKRSLWNILIDIRNLEYSDRRNDNPVMRVWDLILVLIQTPYY